MTTVNTSKLEIVAMAKTKEKGILKLENDYLNRIFFKVTIQDGMPKATFFEKKQLILLDESGSNMDSIAFSNFLKNNLNQHLIFLIGDAYGIPEKLKKIAKNRISLSPFTLPYYLARLVLIEQIYRASTIIKQHPYHH